MKTISDYFGKTLLLTQKSFFNRVYELHADDELISTINYPKVFSTRAVVQAFDKKWEFRKENFWRLDFGIYQEGYEQPFAKCIKGIFKNDAVELPKGERVEINFRIWRNKIDLISDSSGILATFTKRLSWKEKCQVVIEKKSELLDSCPWLIMLVWHVALNRKRRKHSGAY